MGRFIWPLAVLNAVAVFAVGASRQGWPEGFWAGRGAWVLAALFVTAAVPVIQVGLSEYGERSRRRAMERREKLEVFLTTTLIQIARHAGADWENTGVQVFAVRRVGLLRRREQVRLAKVRLGAVPSSGVKWPKGKGVIGRCWESRRIQYEDLDRAFNAYRAFTEGQWVLLSHQARFGLTYDDFQRLKGKYGIVAAVPIIDRNDKYLGCITVDMPPRRDVDKAEILKSLTASANLVKEVI